MVMVGVDDDGNHHSRSWLAWSEGWVGGHLALSQHSNELSELSQ